MEEKKGENELSMANEILSLVSNLTIEDAWDYASLYIQVKLQEFNFDENEVYKLLAETDSRFELKVEGSE